MTSDTERLIDAVRQYPFLFDNNHASYKDKETKTYVWTEIASDLKMENGDAAKTKWRNLKDSYLKYKRNIDVPTGQANNSGGHAYYKKYQKWPWADRMEFLDGHYGKRENSNIERTKRLKSTESQPSTSEKLDLKRKIESNSAVDAMIDYLEKRRKIGDGQDHIDNLFLSYANTFKRLTPRIQIDVKFKMAQMFAHAEKQTRKKTKRLQFTSTSPPQSD